jgi:long-chain fatty acid transport protein
LEESILNPRNDGEVFGLQLAPLILPSQDPTLASRSIARLLPEGRARFAGTSFAPGVTVGYLFKMPRHKTNFGVMWRSPVTFHVSGKASFAFTKGYALEQFIGAGTIPALFPKQDIKASFTTPGTFSVGIANSAFHKITFDFDFLFQNYRRFKDIPLNFSKTQGTATPAELRFNFNFQNTYFLRVGAERALTNKTTVRAGYYFDKFAAPDASVTPFFPDNSKHVLTFGASRKMGNKEFSLFYQGAFQNDRTVNVAANANNFSNGTYKVFIHLIGFSLRLNKGATTIDNE